MDYIQRLKELNITFNKISENDAATIIEKQYSYYKLLEYSSLFEKYKRTDNIGKFVKLDFSQLYYLALIDTKWSQLVMCMCLEIENCLKTRLIFDGDRIGDTKLFLHEYYRVDREYLEETYNYENIDALKSINSTSIDYMDLSQFLTFIQFGTLENLIHFFYKKYALTLYGSPFAPFEKQLYAVRRIRNIVAHNNSLIAKLSIPNDHKNLELSSFLGSHGIKNKTLKTNMSKEIISDLCDFLYLYFNIVPTSCNALTDLSDFDFNFCQKYSDYFKNNYLLKSVYSFIKSVIQIFTECTPLDKF